MLCARAPGHSRGGDAILAAGGVVARPMCWCAPPLRGAGGTAPVAWSPGPASCTPGLASPGRGLGPVAAMWGSAALSSRPSRASRAPSGLVPTVVCASPIPAGVRPSPLAGLGDSVRTHRRRSCRCQCCGRVLPCVWLGEGGGGCCRAPRRGRQDHNIPDEDRVHAMIAEAYVYEIDEEVLLMPATGIYHAVKGKVTKPNEEEAK